MILTLHNPNATVCDCIVQGDAYDGDELLAMPIANGWYIIHIECGLKARDGIPTE